MMLEKSEQLLHLVKVLDVEIDPDPVQSELSGHLQTAPNSLRHITDIEIPAHFYSLQIAFLVDVVGSPQTRFCDVNANAEKKSFNNMQYVQLVILVRRGLSLSSSSLDVLSEAVYNFWHSVHVLYSGAAGSDERSCS